MDAAWSKGPHYCHPRRDLMPYVGYAVVLYFNPVMTAKIKTLWDAIRINCGSREVGVQPHISLAVIEDEKPTLLSALTGAFAQRSKRLPVALNAIGIFPTAEGVVYL